MNGHHFVAMELLRRNDIDVNIADNQGTSPLMRAIFSYTTFSKTLANIPHKNAVQGSYECAKLLIARPDVDINYATTQDDERCGSCISVDLQTQKRHAMKRSAYYMAKMEGLTELCTLMEARPDFDHANQTFVSLGDNQWVWFHKKETSLATPDTCEAETGPAATPELSTIVNAVLLSFLQIQRERKRKT